MKTKFKNLIAIVCVQIVAVNFINIADAQTSNSQKLDEVIEIKDFKNLHKSGDFYFGGQPTYEMAKWLKSESVKSVINLRTNDENKKFTQSAFNEEDLFKELNIHYISIPVSYPDSYNPKTLEQFSKALIESDGKIFIHCASGGRVKSLFMAYLIQVKGYTINEAIEFGKQMNYIFPLENLLGKNIEMTFKE
ncbi:dual specificity protein phosphatase family protein, partial [Bacteroidota bacterium]